MSQIVRGIVGVVGAVVILLATPSESQAGICNWFRPNPSACSSQATTYAPPFVPQVTTVGYAPAFGGCAPCSSCCVPQTAYRPVCVTRPVVAYMPVQTCGPCGATVAYQPTTTWVRQVRMVPYSTYRVVYSNPCTSCFSPCYSACSSPCGLGGCATGGCATGGCATGSCGVTYAAPSGCSTCATTTTVTTPQPTLTPSPTPAQSPAPSSAPAASPAPQSAPGALPTPTFRNSETGPTDLRMKPIPSSVSTPAGTLPRLNAPDNHTAQRPVYHAAYYFTSSSSAAVPTVKSQVIDDVDGWQVGRQ